MTDTSAPAELRPGEAPVVRGDALVVDALPSFRFSHHSLMWWGTFGIVAIEGTVFAIAIVAYFYVRTQVNVWPPGLLPPDLRWGTINVALLLLSAIPNEWTKRAAIARDLRKVRIGIWVCLAMACAMLVLRGLEFSTLNCRWDSNAYGSAVWLLLGLHTVHLATDAFDTAVLAVLLLTGPLDGRRYVDVEENSIYWYFVVLAWLPVYAVIYVAPRFL